MPFQGAPLSLEASVDEIRRTTGNGFRSGELYRAANRLVTDGGGVEAINATSKALRLLGATEEVASRLVPAGAGVVSMAQAIQESVLHIHAATALEGGAAIDLAERTMEMQEMAGGPVPSPNNQQKASVQTSGYIPLYQRAGSTLTQTDS